MDGRNFVIVEILKVRTRDRAHQAKLLARRDTFAEQGLELVEVVGAGNREIGRLLARLYFLTLEIGPMTFGTIGRDEMTATSELRPEVGDRRRTILLHESRGRLE